MITTRGNNTVLKYAPFRGTTEEEAREHYAKRPKDRDLLLCINCGYTALHAWGCYYLSHVNIMYDAGTRGVWSIGDEYILKERAIEEEIWGEQSWLGPEYPITRFLEANSKIPVVKYVKHWTDSESHFFFMERIPGKSLYNLYNGLTHADLLVLAEEAADYLVELRSFTSDKLQAPGGEPIRDKNINPQHPPHFWTSDVDKWWAGVEPHIKDKSKKDILKEKYRLCVKPEGPFVLTHGDLNAQNIMVKDMHISGIIDWERGGYLPEWWEWRQLTKVQLNVWGDAVIDALGRRNALPSEEEMTLWKSFYRIFYDAFEDRSGFVRRNPKWKTNDREFYLTQPSYPHYHAEEKRRFCEDIAERNREGIEKIEAEKKAIEDRIKTAEDRAKVAEEKLAENETILAEFNKLSVEEKENLKRRK